MRLIGETTINFWRFKNDFPKAGNSFHYYEATPLWEWYLSEVEYVDKIGFFPVDYGVHVREDGREDWDVIRDELGCIKRVHLDAMGVHSYDVLTPKGIKYRVRSWNVRDSRFAFERKELQNA
ncbi:MAG: hypothetical protein HQL31_13765 [Planctomycetes bacterium]|nr:hypothetical protein [Planctomycetota bacterium]